MCIHGPCTIPDTSIRAYSLGRIERELNRLVVVCAVLKSYVDLDMLCSNPERDASRLCAATAAAAGILSKRKRAAQSFLLVVNPAQHQKCNSLRVVCRDS